MKLYRAWTCYWDKHHQEQHILLTLHNWTTVSAMSTGRIWQSLLGREAKSSFLSLPIREVHSYFPVAFLSASRSSQTLKIPHSLTVVTSASKLLVFVLLPLCLEGQDVPSQTQDYKWVCQLLTKEGEVCQEWRGRSQFLAVMHAVTLVFGWFRRWHLRTLFQRCLCPCMILVVFSACPICELFYIYSLLCVHWHFLIFV